MIELFDRNEVRDILGLPGNSMRLFASLLKPEAVCCTNLHHHVSQKRSGTILSLIKWRLKNVEKLLEREGLPSELVLFASVQQMVLLLEAWVRVRKRCRSAVAHPVMMLYQTQTGYALNAFHSLHTLIWWLWWIFNFEGCKCVISFLRLRRLCPVSMASVDAQYSSISLRRIVKKRTFWGRPQLFLKTDQRLLQLWIT